MGQELRTALRVLGLRATREELRNLNMRHLVLGLALTWIVGMGRWWEDPRASIIQHVGVGSLVYVVLLAAFFWLLILPLAPRPWRYLNVLSFVALTSPPALLYAIPVRGWFDLATAQQIRLWFLAIVSLWRVLMWARYLYVGVGLTAPATAVTTLFPLTLIVVVLTSLNLERAVFQIMGAIRPEDLTVDDRAYAALNMLSLLAVLAFVPLLVAYITLAVLETRARSQSPRTAGDDV